MLTITVTQTPAGRSEARFSDPSNSFPIWGLYECPTDHLSPWTTGRALTRMIELCADDDRLADALAWMEVGLTPVGRAAVIIAAASITTPNMTAEEAHEDVLRYWPEEDLTRTALLYVTKARLARG